MPKAKTPFKRPLRVPVHEANEPYDRKLLSPDEAKSLDEAVELAMQLRGNRQRRDEIEKSLLVGIAYHRLTKPSTNVSETATHYQDVAEAIRWYKKRAHLRGPREQLALLTAAARGDARYMYPVVGKAVLAQVEGMLTELEGVFEETGRSLKPKRGGQPDWRRDNLVGFCWLAVMQDDVVDVQPRSANFEELCKATFEAAGIPNQSRQTIKRRIKRFRSQFPTG